MQGYMNLYMLVNSDYFDNMFYNIKINCCK